MRNTTAAAVAALVLLAATACGIRPTGVISAGSKPIAGNRPGPITLYLLKDGRLTPVQRPGLPDHGTLAIPQLGVPLTVEERRRGLTTRVPRVRLTPDPVTIVAEGELEPSTLLEVTAGEKRRWSRAALAQLACTAEQIQGVRRTTLRIEPGEDSGVIRSYLSTTRQEPPPDATHLLLTCAAFADLK
ncbi:hypothetical protein [Actinomadura hibisca]|uniref:hypothetical protein n=1 Tax=Actinomadura hibisca TaxID=68565 RepID=UPI00082FAC67|nr:hypothetical protein [Actinomadura hibisca]